MFLRPKNLWPCVILDDDTPANSNLTILSPNTARNHLIGREKRVPASSQRIFLGKSIKDTTFGRTSDKIPALGIFVLFNKTLGSLGSLDIVTSSNRELFFLKKASSAFVGICLSS